MENEIKEKKYIGKYIRNKYGLAKVVDVFKENDIVFLKLDNNIVFDVDRESGEISDKFLRNIYPVTENVNLEERIKNIIDLIDANDIGIMSYNGMVFRKFISRDDIVALKLKEYRLLELVTKEQFESISYKVKQEEN